VSGPIDVAELSGLPTEAFVSVSWAGDRLLHYSDRTGRRELCLLDLETGARRQLTRGEAPAWSRFPEGAWDRAGRSVVFGRDRDGDERFDLFRLDVASGAVTQLTRGAGGPEWAVEHSPDGRWLSVISVRGGQLDLWRLAADGSRLEQLTHAPAPVAGGWWSPDGRWLAIAMSDGDGWLVAADGSERRRVLRVAEGSRDAIAAWHPDGRRLVVSSDASGCGRVGVLDLRDGDVCWLTPDGVDEGPRAVLSPDGRLVATLRNERSLARPVVYDLAGGAGRPLRVPDGVTSELAFAGPRRLVLQASTSATRPSVSLYDLATDRVRAVLPADYGGIDPSAFVDSEHVVLPGGIPALLFRPRASGRLRALVLVHGGPTAQFTRAFDPIVQLLVSRGIVVLEPNVRGSTGYGTAFRDAVIGDWAGADLDDLLGVTDWLKRQPYVDPARVAFLGGSYGGYLALAAATARPDACRAVVMRAAFSDLPSLNEEAPSALRFALRQQMGDPVARADLWRERSPINAVDRLRARLLIVHGVNDARCPVSQARALRARLLAVGRREGADFEYVELADEGHGTADIAHKTRTMRLMIDFLERVL
jgi:dipeptidyl aminopeptidase/acylaminoacyl peptidase